MFDPITATLAVVAVASGYQAYQGNEARKDAKRAANKQIENANTLRFEEDRNRLQSVMAMQKRRGVAQDTLLTSPDAVSRGALGGGLFAGGGGKTLLGL